MTDAPQANAKSARETFRELARAELDHAHGLQRVLQRNYGT